MMDRCRGWCSEGSLLATHVKRGGSYCSEVLFTIFRVTIVYQQLCGSLKTLYRNGFSRGVWVREQKEITRERVAAMPWPNDRIASVTTLWLECLLNETVCCWFIVNLNWTGVKPGQMLFQIPRRPLKFGMVSLAVLTFTRFRSYSLHHLALNLVLQFWLCWGDMQPDATSAIGFILVCVCGAFPWVGGFQNTARSVMKEPGFLRWKRLWRELKSSPFRFQLWLLNSREGKGVAPGHTVS